MNLQTLQTQELEFDENLKRMERLGFTYKAFPGEIYQFYKNETPRMFVRRGAGTLGFLVDLEEKMQVGPLGETWRGVSEAMYDMLNKEDTNHKPVIVWKYQVGDRIVSIESPRWPCHVLECGYISNGKYFSETNDPIATPGYRVRYIDGEICVTEEGFYKPEEPKYSKDEIVTVLLTDKFVNRVFAGTQVGFKFRNAGQYVQATVKLETGTEYLTEQDLKEGKIPRQTYHVKFHESQYLTNGTDVTEFVTADVNFLSTYEWSEVFMSIEGEAQYAGHPTVYIRFARCNFQCRGFNNPTNDVQPDGYATLGWKPEDYKTLQSIPLIHKGCDSQYAVNPKFAHMWGQGDEKALAAEVLKVLPHNTFQNPVTGKRVILSLTGGEPTIRLKFWIPILNELYAHGMRSILIETNCAAPMRDKDLAALYQWAAEKDYTGPGKVKIIWSNSPKLRMSGEVWEDAIRPSIALQQTNPQFLPIYGQYGPPATEQYFKFVCGANETDFNEVAQAMEAYHDAGISRDVDVYIMPVACTEEQQLDIAAKVASMCMDKGYIYCHRIQNSVFGNGVGT